MGVTYPVMYRELYQKISRLTGMSNEEIDMFILTMIKVLSSDLNRNGKVILPYMGQFHLKRMPPRKRCIKDFATGDTHTIQLPAMDKLKFTINKQFSKLFR